MEVYETKENGKKGKELKNLSRKNLKINKKSISMRKKAVRSMLDFLYMNMLRPTLRLAPPSPALAWKFYRYQNGSNKVYFWV